MEKGWKLMIEGALYGPEEANAIIVGIDMGDGVSKLIKRAMDLFESYDASEKIDPFERLRVSEVEIGARKPEEISEKLRGVLREGIFYIFLAKEHVVSPFLYPLFDANLLFIDAHADLREEYEGKRVCGETAFRRMLEVAKGKAEWWGIRSMSKEEEGILNQIKRFDPRRKGKLYISVDIDVLDPCYAPHVAYPEPCGASPSQLLDILKKAFKREVVAVDVVGVQSNSIDLTCAQAAWLVMKLLSLQAKAEEIKNK